MLKTIAAAVTVAALAAMPAAADISKKHGRASKNHMKQGKSQMLPPAGYSGQWWTAPNNCEYSRAGRPGEVVWYLIINTAHRGCAPYLVQKGRADAY